MFSSIIRIGHAPADEARVRQVKTIFAIAMVGATLFSLQLTLFEFRTTIESIIDWTAIAGTVGSLIVLQIGKRIDHAFMFVAGVALIVLAAALLTLGNRYGSGFFLPLIPIFAVVLLGAKRSLPWFAATLFVVLAAAAGDAVLPEFASVHHRSDLNPNGLLFHGPGKVAMTHQQYIALLSSLTLLYVVAYSAHSALLQANERVESLLLNILPPSIAARLSAETSQKLSDDGAGIADEFSEATILFADIVGFTELAAKSTTAELMSILDQVFTRFDELAERHRVEKIKTIGDAYMAVCGLPEPDPDHAENIADMALEMLEAVKNFREESDLAIHLKIGINTGPVIAGVIGRKKFIYDLWGDAVNVASRMESLGAPDMIQVSTGTQKALMDSYDFEPLGHVQIKGKGELPAWRLIGRKVS